LTNLFSLSLAVAILKEKYSLVLGVFCEGRKSRTWLLLRTRACKGCEREKARKNKQTNTAATCLFTRVARGVFALLRHSASSARASSHAISHVCGRVFTDKNHCWCHASFSVAREPLTTLTALPLALAAADRLVPPILTVLVALRFRAARVPQQKPLQAPAGAAATRKSREA
jgi:hypothetical protein